MAKSNCDQLEHEKRIRMVENILISTKADTQWMKIIGGTMMSLLIAIATLTYQQGGKISALNTDHQTIVNDHEASEEDHNSLHDVEGGQKDKGENHGKPDEHKH